MSEAIRPGPPKSILLATDLSPRCDRALDRAVALSQHWDAKLVILHVVESQQGAGRDTAVPSWRRSPDPVSVARRQLVADAGEAMDRADIVISEGDPAEAIAQTVLAKGCDLVVTGIARDELLGRFFLGTTVDRLLRICPVPLLVVRNRARHAYRHIAMATDFSPSSRHALETANCYFPHQLLSIFHAYVPPRSGLMSDPAAFRSQYHASVTQEYEAFVASLDSGEAIRKRARPFIEFGAPADILRQGVRDMQIDLVVLGTQGRSGLLGVLIGSVAREILSEVPCDVLLVRQPRE